MNPFPSKETGKKGTANYEGSLSSEPPLDRVKEGKQDKDIHPRTASLVNMQKGTSIFFPSCEFCPTTTWNQYILPHNWQPKSNRSTCLTLKKHFYCNKPDFISTNWLTGTDIIWKRKKNALNYLSTILRGRISVDDFAIFCCYWI